MRSATLALLVSLGMLVSGSALAQKSISGPVGRAIPAQPIAKPPPSHGHGHHHHRTFVGGGFGYGWGWWYPPPYYYYYPVPIEPVTYIEQGDAAVEPRWWYYCQSSTSYYPYVRECPTGWERVAPQ